MRPALYALAQVFGACADAERMDIASVGSADSSTEALAIAALAKTMRTARDSAEALVQLIAETPAPSAAGTGRFINTRA